MLQKRRHHRNLPCHNWAAPLTVAVLAGCTCDSRCTYRMYMMTPRDHISQDLSYFSGPSTSGAANRKGNIPSSSYQLLLSVSVYGKYH